MSQRQEKLLAMMERQKGLWKEAPEESLEKEELELLEKKQNVEEMMKDCGNAKRREDYC